MRYHAEVNGKTCCIEAGHIDEVPALLGYSPTGAGETSEGIVYCVEDDGQPACLIVNEMPIAHVKSWLADAFGMRGLPNVIVEE